MRSKLLILFMCPLVSFALMSCGSKTPPSSEKNQEVSNSLSDNSHIPADAVTFEVDLGDRGNLNFSIPKMFDDKLYVALSEPPEGGYVREIRLYLKGGEDKDPSFHMLLMEKTIYDKWTDNVDKPNNWIPPLEILVQDNYLLGYYNLQYNPYEDDQDTPEYELMQHYSELRNCIIASISWIK